MSKLHVLIVQPNTIWERPEDNFQRIEALVRDKTDGANLVVLPEMFATGFSMNTDNIATSGAAALNWMQAMAHQWQCAIMGSVAWAEAGRGVNRAFLVSPNQEPVYYDKRHLFRMGKEEEVFSPGNCRKVFELNGWRILPQVCYDLRFPVWMRNTEGYHLAVVLANWPVARHEAWQTLLKARAIENLAYVVGVNRTGTDGNGIGYGGGSLAIDFKGQVIADAGTNEKVMKVVLEKENIEAFKEKFPAHLDADTFCLGY